MLLPNFWITENHWGISEPYLKGKNAHLFWLFSWRFDLICWGFAEGVCGHCHISIRKEILSGVTDHEFFFLAFRFVRKATASASKKADLLPTEEVPITCSQHNKDISVFCSTCEEPYVWHVCSSHQSIKDMTWRKCQKPWKNVLNYHKKFCTISAGDVQQSRRPSSKRQRQVTQSAWSFCNNCRNSRRILQNQIAWLVPPASQQSHMFHKPARYLLKTEWN